MTKAQKEEKARNERKLQQMIAAGIRVGPAAEGEAEKEKEREKEKKKADARKRGGLVKVRACTHWRLDCFCYVLRS
jgi:translation initiation factor 5B